MSTSKVVVLLALVVGLAVIGMLAYRLQAPAQHPKMPSEHKRSRGIGVRKYHRQQQDQGVPSPHSYQHRPLRIALPNPMVEPSKMEPDHPGCIARRSRLREDFRAAWVCQLGRQGCFFKCPGGRWVSNGWLEVDDMLPLMEDIYKQAGVGVNPTRPFVYLDVGCKLAEEAVQVLQKFPNSTVVALEMRPEFAAKCEANARAAASPSQSVVVVLNKAAAMTAGQGKFAVRGDASSIRPHDAPGGEEGASKPKENSIPIEFVTLESVWEEHLAPMPINLLKTDAEGWDGLILQNGARDLLRNRTVDAFIFEYHGRKAGVYFHGKLQDYVTQFWEWGYTCFHITCSFLFPLTPPDMWLPEYEYYAQGNVFCALSGSRLLWKTYENYFGDPGFKDSFEARQTEGHAFSPNTKLPNIAVNFTGFAAEYGEMLKHDSEHGCLSYRPQ